MATGIVTRTRVSILATALVAGLVVAAPIATPKTPGPTSAVAQGAIGSSPSARSLRTKPTLSMFRKTNRSAPRLVIRGLDGRVTVTTRYRVNRPVKRVVTRAATNQRQVGARSSWTLMAPRTTYRVTVRAAGVDPLTKRIRAKRINRTFRFTVQPPNSATDFTRFGTPATFWDACTYGVTSKTNTVSSVTPSSTLYYGGSIPDKFADHVKFALGKITEVTGFRFEYVRNPRSINYLKFAIKDDSKKASKLPWELSGMAGPGWVDYNSGKSRYTGADISLNLMDQAPSNALRRLIMHEAGHAMGLSHAKYATQVMYKQVEPSAPVWGNGDFAGLRQLANRGCHFEVGEDLN